MLKSENYYLLRTPGLPLETIDIEIENFESYKSFIESVFSGPEFNEAIQIASPVLYGEALKIFNQKTDTKETRKIYSSVFNYILRGSSRCTPFGQFAGFSTGEAGISTNIRLAEKESHHPHFRLDMDFLQSLIDEVAKIRSVQQSSRFYPNNSIFLLNGKYFYLEYILKNFKTYQVSQVDHSEYLEDILKAAGEGLNIESLAEVIDDEDITQEEKTEFIHELIDAQLLINELEPEITGQDPFSGFLQKMMAIAEISVSDETQQVVKVLHEIQGLLNGDFLFAERVRHISRLTDSISDKIGAKDVLQVDLGLNMQHNTIKEEVLGEVVQDLEKIYLLFAEERMANLHDFKSAFSARFDQQEIPLTVALDAEYGVGYSDYKAHTIGVMPLLDEVNVFLPSAPASASWSPVYQLLLEKMLKQDAMDADVLVITEQEIEKITAEKKDKLNIPDSLFIVGSLLAENMEALDKGDFKFSFKSCAGPSSVRLMARFSALDSVLKDKLRESIAHEEAFNPDCIYAEVVHLPQSRTGNIINRPQLRDYEIPYIGKSGADIDKQINIEDLYVSLKQGKVVLRSKSMNKQIIPRMSNAHTFSYSGLPVYKFLCELQFQDLIGGFAWDWGPFSELPKLPRVIFNHLIVSPKIWNIDFSEYLDEYLLQTSFPDVFDKFRDQIQQMSQHLQLPDQVVYANGENELLIQLKSFGGLNVLYQLLRKKMKIELREFIFNKDNLLLADVHAQKYTNEIIIPVGKMNAVSAEKKAASFSREMKVTSINRTSFLNDNWVYIKLYTGIKNADYLLRNVIPEFIEEIEKESLISEWFFIRYADPDYHIRLRILRKDLPGGFALLTDKINKFFDPLLRQHQIFKIQFDTYEKEIERYGEENMRMVEHLFYIDSKFMVPLFRRLGGDIGEDLRWLMMLLSVDRYFDDFRLSMAERYDTIKGMSESFVSEFGGSASLKKQLNSKYRAKRTLIEDLLINQSDQYSELYDLMKCRTQALQDAMNSLLDNDNSPAQLRQIVIGYIHMCINRFSLSNPRKHELVIYYFLEKHYQSVISRPKIINELTS